MPIIRDRALTGVVPGLRLGSTSLTTDAAGNVVARQRYLPYGQERWTTGDVPTDFGFTHGIALTGLP